MSVLFWMARHDQAANQDGAPHEAHQLGRRQRQPPVRDGPAHGHVEIGFGTGGSDDGSRGGTQFHPKVYLDLIWLIADAAQILDNAFGDRQDGIERFLQRFFGLDDAIPAACTNRTRALRLVHFDDNTAALL